MTAPSCRDCIYYRPPPNFSDPTIEWCGLHAVSCDYARMTWFRDRSNTIVSEENCGVQARFFQARAN